MLFRALRRATIAVPTALGLFGASLVLLLVGRFIQLDDTSGSGYNDSVLPLGYLAGVLGFAGVVVSSAERTARRLLGGVLLVLVAGVILLAVTDDGFRFIWRNDEGELMLFVITVGITALVLLTPRFTAAAATTGSTQTAPAFSGWARGLIYLLASIAVTVIAFGLGAAHSDSTSCQDTSAGECDLSGVEGAAWAAAALALMIMVVILSEAVRFRRRARRQREASPG